MKYYTPTASKRIATRSPLLLSCLLLAILAFNAHADLWFDVNGTTAGYGTATNGSYSWDDANWATASGGTTATGSWTSGSFARFIGTNSYTITVNGDEVNAGVLQIPATGTAANNVLTINAAGSGSLDILPGSSLTAGLPAQGFFCTSLGKLYINAPITGSGGMNLGVISGTGEIHLRGINTYSGGTALSTSSYLMYFNNNNSFGTGPICINGTTFAALLSEGGAPITLANNWTNIAVVGTNGVNFASSANTPVICTGSWVLQTNLNVRNNGNSTAPLTLSGPISGDPTPALILSANSSGKITLSGASTYTGKTIIAAGSTGVTLSVGSFNSVSGGTPTSNLGAPTTVADGTISIGSTTLASTLIYTGPGETTDRVIDLAGTTGGATNQADGTGPLVFTSDFTASGNGAKTLTLQGSNTGNNSVKGAIVDSAAGGTSVTKAGTGTWELAGKNTYSRGTSLTAGQLNIESANALSIGTFTNNGSGKFDNTSGADLTIANTALALTGGFHYVGSVNNLTLSTPVLSGNGPNRNMTVDGHTLTVNALSQDTLGNGFSKLGSGTARMVGTATYTGATIVTNTGTLQVDGSIASSSSVTVNSGTLTGSGTTPSVTVNNSGTIAPGNGIGSINTGNETWNSGGHYAWQINDANGTAGTDPGYDTIAINGTLNIAATSSSRFNIDIQSLSGSTPGNAANLGTSGTWTIATTTGGITGFDASLFNINTNGLSNSTGGSVFALSLSPDSKSLLLNLVVPVQNIQNYSATGAGTGTFTGSPNTSYTVQFTDSLSPINWQTLTVVTTDGAGAGSYTDPGPLPSQRFYRISTP